MKTAIFIVTLMATLTLCSCSSGPKAPKLDPHAFLHPPEAPYLAALPKTEN